MKSFREYKDEKQKVLLEKDKFKNQGATPDEKIWKLWRSLINMTPKELQAFYDSPEAKGTGLTKEEQAKEDLKTAREACRMVMKMLPDSDTFEKTKEKWTPFMWYWARKHNSYISRMRGMRKKMVGDPFEKDGKPTKWMLSLKIWGNDPRKPLRKV